MIELITVVVLLSILGVAALGRMDNLDSYGERSYYLDTLNAVRYAQKLAISTGCNVQVSLASGRYDLFQGRTGCTDSTNVDRPVVHPADRSQNYAAVAPSGVTISPQGAAPSSFTFTPQSTVSGFSSAFAEYDIGSYRFRIYQYTGLVDEI